MAFLKKTGFQKILQINLLERFLIRELCMLLNNEASISYSFLLEASWGLFVCVSVCILICVGIYIRVGNKTFELTFKPANEATPDGVNMLGYKSKRNQANNDGQCP